MRPFEWFAAGLTGVGQQLDTSGFGLENMPGKTAGPTHTCVHTCSHGTAVLGENIKEKREEEISPWEDNNLKGYYLHRGLISSSHFLLIFTSPQLTTFLI